ncbi:MAG: hypothetical protein RLZZ383_1189 [Pseudomonadota bacterium]|jgi:transcriptional regulator with PAS, ATPase and Fis domain
MATEAVGIDEVGAETALRAIAALAPELAWFWVDAERRVQVWSPGAEALLGYRAEDVVGMHCLTANRCAPCQVGCGLRERSVLNDVPLELFDPNGRAVRVRKSGRAFRGADGRFLGGLEVLRPDATDAVPHLGVVPVDPEEVVSAHGIVTADPAMKRILAVLRNVAETDVTVLVRGESGTGKELIARAVHEASMRRDGPFVAVNCAALTPSLIESELFGHVRGSFTGALGDRKGVFEQADGGTLFLDEVAELALDVQAKLLRVLQEREVTPVGSMVSKRIDVRIVAATHRALRAEVAAGRFREDLLYRLRVVPLFLPPLRERVADVLPIARVLIEARNAQGPRRVRRVEGEVIDAWLAHPWPGNIRELQNVIDYAFAVGRGEALTLADLPPELGGQAPVSRPRAAAMVLSEAPPSAEVLDDALRERIVEALAQSGGHVQAAADALGMSRATFWRHRRRLLGGDEER